MSSSTATSSNKRPRTNSDLDGGAVTKNAAVSEDNSMAVDLDLEAAAWTRLGERQTYGDSVTVSGKQTGRRWDLLNNFVLGFADGQLGFQSHSLIRAISACLGSRQVLGIFHALKGEVDTFEQLAALVGKGFVAGHLAKRWEVSACSDFYLTWARKHSAALLEDPKGGFKYVGADYIQYAESQYFWPPPIVDLYSEELQQDTSTASSLWTAKGVWNEAQAERVQLEVRALLGTASVGFFQLCTCSTALLHFKLRLIVI
jgi:hypothetical protein